MLRLLIALFLFISCKESNPIFDENKAFDYLLKQCDFGPRNPGSEGYFKCRDFMIAELKKSTDTVITQNFTYTDEKENNLYELQNIIARFNPNSKFQTIISCHWDTRPWADMDEEKGNHKQAILGANDGASGVAILLELANILALNPPTIGVNLVLFDGEDMGVSGIAESYCQGSQFFAKNLPFENIKEAINLDMVGDRQLQLPIERNSYEFHPQLVRYLWSRAKEMKLDAFQNRLESAIYDDHVPLYEYAGIPSIDIIDFRYPNHYQNYWHTLEDIPKHCSAKSLGQVGRLMVDYIYNREKQTWNSLN